MSDDIFCKIVRGEEPCFKVAEDRAHLAFMDIFPPTFDGQIICPVVLTIPKAHAPSDIMDLPPPIYFGLNQFTYEVAQAVKEGLGCFRVMHIDEGMEIEHAHSKLYGFERSLYPGWLSSKKSEHNTSIRAPDAWLDERAQKIRSAYAHMYRF
jgi:histidine triad (HIT) family protein